MADVTVTMNESALKRLLKSPEGPVGRYIETKGGRVDQLATDYANGQGPGPGPKMRTMDLATSIFQSPVRIVNGELQTDIGAPAIHREVAYGILQERGGYTPQGANYRYPFLEPALAAVFGQQFRR